MIEAALKTLESGCYAPDSRDDAIESLAFYIESHTRTQAVVAKSETTERIARVIVKLLDGKEERLPISSLIWMLGRLNVPDLESHYKRWLLTYVQELKRFNSARTS